jgi:hypothetical protein
MRSPLHCVAFSFFEAKKVGRGVVALFPNEGLHKSGSPELRSVGAVIDHCCPK